MVVSDGMSWDCNANNDYPNGEGIPKEAILLSCKDRAGQ